MFSRLENYENLEQQVVQPSQREIRRRDGCRDHPQVAGSGFWLPRPSRSCNGIPLWFSFDSSAGLLSRSEPFFQNDPTAANPYTLAGEFQTGEFMNRVNLAPHVTTAFHLGALQPGSQPRLRGDVYSEAQTQRSEPDHGQNQNQVVGANIVRSARDFSLDMIFPSLARVFSKKTIFGDKLKHVIEPRATYRYVTGVGDDFNRFIRFDETDLLADTNEVELSLTNRIYAKRGDSVQEIFTWELAQKRYFDPTFGGAPGPGQPTFSPAPPISRASRFWWGRAPTPPVVSMLRISPINGLGNSLAGGLRPRTAKTSSDSSFRVDYREEV